MNVPTPVPFKKILKAHLFVLYLLFIILLSLFLLCCWSYLYVILIMYCASSIQMCHK